MPFVGRMRSRQSIRGGRLAGTLIIALLALLMPSRPAVAGGEEAEAFLLSARLHGDANGDGVINSHDDELYLFTTNSSSPRRLTRNGFRERAVSLAPNRRHFVFFGDPVDTIYLSDVVGGYARPVLSTSVSMTSGRYVNINPLLRSFPWAADSRSIFVSFAFPVNQWYALRLGGPRLDIGPATWSPRVQRLALSGFDQRRLRAVHDVKSHGLFPSANGSHAVFIDGKKGAAFLVNLRNGRRRRVLHDRFLYQTTASWSPDGRRVSLYRLNYRRRTDELLVLNVAKRRVIWRRGGAVRAGEAWSPNGQRLAFTTTRGLGMYDFDLGRVVTPAHEGRDLHFPVWSKDGEKVYALAAPQSENARLETLGAGTGTRRLVSRIPRVTRLLARVQQP